MCLMVRPRRLLLPLCLVIIINMIVGNTIPAGWRGVLHSINIYPMYNKDAALAGSLADQKAWFAAEINEWSQEAPDSQAARVEMLDALGSIVLFNSKDFSQFAFDFLKRKGIGRRVVSNAIHAYPLWHEKQVTKKRRGAKVTKEQLVAVRERIST